MGYPSGAQTSGQFSFNSFRSYWVSAIAGPGSDFGAHLRAWEGQTYYPLGSASADTWPTTNMHMFLFYGVQAVATGGGK